MSLKTLRILSVRITVVMDLMLTVVDAKSKMIPTSVDITTKKSKQFQESLNYSKPKLMFFKIHSTLNTNAKI